MGDVENAIAKALKKDGITPKPVKLSAKSESRESKELKELKELKESLKELKEPKESKELKEVKGETSSSGKSSKRRKHKSEKDPQRKKARLTDDDTEIQSVEHKAHQYESEDFDEYEMMNVRGGSPNPHGNAQKNMMYYDSGKNEENKLSNL